MTPYKLKKKMYPLVYAAQVVNSDLPKNSTAGYLLNSYYSIFFKDFILFI